MTDVLKPNQQNLNYPTNNQEMHVDQGNYDDEDVSAFLENYEVSDDCTWLDDFIPGMYDNDPIIKASMAKLERLRNQDKIEEQQQIIQELLDTVSANQKTGTKNTQKISTNVVKINNNEKTAIEAKKLAETAKQADQIDLAVRDKEKELQEYLTLNPEFTIPVEKLQKEIAIELVGLLTAATMAGRIPYEKDTARAIVGGIKAISGCIPVFGGIVKGIGNVVEAGAKYKQKLDYTKVKRVIALHGGNIEGIAKLVSYIFPLKVNLGNKKILKKLQTKKYRDKIVKASANCVKVTFAHAYENIAKQMNQEGKSFASVICSSITTSMRTLANKGSKKNELVAQFKSQQKKKFGKNNSVNSSKKNRKFKFFS